METTPLQYADFSASLSVEDVKSLVPKSHIVWVAQASWASPAANSTRVRVGLPDMPFRR